MDKTQKGKWLLKWAFVMATLVPSVLIMRDFQEKETLTAGGIVGLIVSLVLTAMTQAAFDVSAYRTIAEAREKNGIPPLTIRMWKTYTKQSTIAYVFSYFSLSVISSWSNGSFHSYWNIVLPTLFTVIFIRTNRSVYRKVVSLTIAAVAADDESESFHPLATKD